MTNNPLSPSRYDSNQYFKNQLPKYLSKTKNLIDIGCGKLYFLKMLQTDINNFDGNYFGIDITIPHVTEKLQKTSNIKFKKISVLDFRTNKKFDTAVCLWVLEHIEGDELALDKMNKLLKRKGVLVIAAPSIWSWPFEFGRHGFHYYSKIKLNNMINLSGFRVLENYSAGGLLGDLFMIFYNWQRFLILIPLYFIHKPFSIFGKKTSWEDISKRVIVNTVYRYHRSSRLVNIHNEIVKTIVKFDNKFKILPASYIIIAQKK